MAKNLPSCFFIQFLEQLLKFLVNFTLLKYVKSQRSYGFLTTKELIFGFQILDLKDHFSASLTESLERVSNYAKRWKLKISAKKTKIIVFNKAGKIINAKLRIYDILMQSYSEYIYLSTVFTPGNSFKKAQIELYEKACHAFLSFLSAVNFQTGAQVSTVRKLFNSLVCPILLYNSEIWGAFLTPKQLRNLESFENNLFSDTLKHESLQLKMAKISLGVHKKASDMAVRSDIGMYPLNIEIYVRIVKYCFHLLELAKQGMN